MVAFRCYCRLYLFGSGWRDSLSGSCPNIGWPALSSSQWRSLTGEVGWCCGMVAPLGNESAGGGNPRARGPKRPAPACGYLSIISSSLLDRRNKIPPSPRFLLHGHLTSTPLLPLPLSSAFECVFQFFLPSFLFRTSACLVVVAEVVRCRLCASHPSFQYRSVDASAFVRCCQVVSSAPCIWPIHIRSPFTDLAAPEVSRVQISYISSP
jgi:hypothetical protein